MFKSRLLQIILAMLIVITLILVAAFALWTFFEKKNANPDPTVQAKSSVDSVKAKKITPAKQKEQTTIIKDFLTNLADKNKIIKATFAFEMDSKAAKDEFDNLDFKVKSLMNFTLADMTSDQILGSKGYDNLTSVLMNKINESVMTEGKVKQIYITDVIVQ